MRAGLLILILFGAVPAEGFLFSRGELSVEEIEARLASLPEEGRNRTKAVLWSDLGTALYKEGRFYEASKAFEMALRHRTNRFQKRHIYLFMGKSYQSDGRLDKAIASYEKAAQYDRKNWRRHRDLGELYEKVELYPKAIDAYENALRYNGNDAKTWLSLGRSWRVVGVYGTAEESLLRAQKLGLTHPSLYKELALVYEGQGRYDRAATAFDRTIKQGAPISIWGKLIYYAGLGRNKTLANKGLSEMRKLKGSEKILPFYEEFVDFVSRPPEDILKLETTDPTLNKLIDTILKK